MKVPNNPKEFKGTDWLELETAIETIGDVIAYHSAKLNEAIAAKADTAIIEQIESEICRLTRERLACYQRDSTGGLLKKASEEYRLCLARLSQPKVVEKTKPL
ncbi:MAG: hypothetical protein ACKOE6_15105 [Flammeovirgaceae bacterium]